ncbi:hypothetical protein TNCT_659971 [Trichonephila clavata]|uniref:Uncharacterized protein n=1 Tax=Trichonephila clavata TaxID=2740835 RepID=A0A8X6FQ13_TRICU|nr:hypothetical protein TNCT_659971 [Trichonephila clavata]
MCEVKDIATCYTSSSSTHAPLLPSTSTNVSTLSTESRDHLFLIFPLPHPIVSVLWFLHLYQLKRTICHHYLHKVTVLRTETLPYIPEFTFFTPTCHSQPSSVSTTTQTLKQNAQN